MLRKGTLDEAILIFICQNRSEKIHTCLFMIVICQGQTEELGTTDAVQ